MSRLFFIGDVETTGVGNSDKIIEVAGIIVDSDLNEVTRFESLINPDMSIPSGASAVNGITNDMVAGAPTMGEYLRSIGDPLQVYGPMTLVAHNAAFDFRFLSPYMVEDSNNACTLRIARRLWPDADSHKLQALRYSLNLPAGHGDAHRAMFDVEMLFELVKVILNHEGCKLSDLVGIAARPVPVKSMPFGKHKGKKLAELPKDYVQWLLGEKDIATKNPDLISALRKL